MPHDSTRPSETGGIVDGMRALLLTAHRGLSEADWAAVDTAHGDDAALGALRALRRLHGDDPGAGAELLREAAERLAHEPELLVALCAAAAAVQTTIGRWADAAWSIATGRRSVPHPRASADGPASWELAAAAVLVEWHTYAGSSQMLAVREQLLDLGRRNLLDDRHAPALVAVGAVQFGLGEFADAAGWTNRALRLLPTASARSIAARAQFALIRQRQGQWRESYRLAATALELLPADAPPRLRALVEATALLQPALTLDLAAAQPELERLSSLVERHYSVQADTVLDQIRSILLFAMEDWAGLLTFLDDLGTNGYRCIYSTHEWCAMRAAALWNLRWAGRYRAFVVSWADYAGAERSPYYWTHRALLADIDGDPAGFAAHRARAESFADRILDPMGRTWIHLATGYVALRRGSTHDGLAQWELARERMRRAGAASFAELFTAVLERTAGEFAAAADDPLAALTEQQRRVARHVADGLTSAEIAERMHLSRKTVDFHVANIVTRLGLKTRREIRGVLAGR